MVASVIVDIAHSEVDKIFDYCIVQQDVERGSRVVVPFGKTKIEGIVIDVKEKSDYPLNKLKPILRVIDNVPAITKEHLKLMEFMKKIYHIPSALILRLFLPGDMRKGKVREKMVGFVSVCDSFPIEEALAQVGPKARNQIEALKFMFIVKKCKTSELKTKFGNYSVNALIEKGLILQTEERVNRTPYTSLEGSFKKYDLLTDQLNAVKKIESTDKRVALIHGVTGSGKTAVYLELIRKAVESGKSAILLVPEIALTPQMLNELRSYFGECCAILHSGLSLGERFDEWWRLRSGEAKIAVGARSAIFAPLENLGIIIIDEEHDGSYVSESSPRYSTKVVANFRAEFNDCKLVLGSATPSIESYLSAKNGDFELCEMPERINRKPMPEMIIADMRDEVRRGNNSPFSAVLKDELERCIKSGNQAMIFINRRGYSQQIICRECGYVAKCDNCDISLNYHSDGNVLKCHYCGAQYRMPKACPECGGVHINYVGTGTQRIVEDLKRLFPYAKVLRMDNDTTQNKEGHFKILKEFSEKKADILVGTQMIAKGHNFPSVTLVGVLDADMSLFFSDYRSGERTFQLLTQVAGRSGRAEQSGVVVLQTYAPNNPVLKCAINYDYKAFFERECAIRKSTLYPPFSVILRIMVEGKEDAPAMEALRLVYERVKMIYEKNADNFIFFNKMKSPIKRLKNKYRYQVLMRLKTGTEDIIDEIYSSALACSTSKINVYIERNPSNLS